MATLYSVKIGMHRNRPRIYLHSSRLVDEGWSIGDNFDVKQGGNSNLRLVVNNEGSRKVSRKKKAGKDEYQPLIDLHEEDFKKIGDVGSKIRVFVHEGVMIFSKHFQDMKVVERVKSLLDNIGKVNTTSFFHGGGICSRAIHQGLADAGVDSRIGFALEREREYLESSLANNSVMFDKDSVVVNAELKDVQFFNSNLPNTNIFEAGIPCTSFSKANVKTQGAPEATDSGLAFFDTLKGIQAMNPAIIVLENVPEFGKSASANIVRGCLSGWNYKIKEKVLCGHDFGAFENRSRWVCLAVSEGLEEFIDFDDLEYSGPDKPSSFSMIKDENAPEDSWKLYDYLHAKQEKDIAAGKGFRMHIINDDSESCNVIPRSYSKVQSTGALVAHPNSEMLRLFTVGEHARAKTIPPELVDGVSTTRSHQILGQSCIFNVFKSIGYLIGSGIKQAHLSKHAIAA